MALGEAEGERVALLEGVIEGVRVVGPEESVVGEGVLNGVVRREGEGVAMVGPGRRSYA